MIKLEIVQDSEEDTYLGGCLDNTMQTRDFVQNTFATMQDALTFIQEDYGKPYIFDNRLIVQKLENERGLELAPNSLEFDQWVSAEIKGYAVTYNFYITEYFENSIENERLKTEFNKLSEV